MKHRVMPSPIGSLTIVVDDDGALAGLYMEDQRHLPDPAGLGERDDSVGDAVVRQLEEYFHGRRTAFDLPLRPHGTPFQERVWSAVAGIPYGQTRTYGEVAAGIGQPAASRAVGAAIGRNPLCVVVPCHRVVGADGALSGYAGGTVRKAALLRLESPAEEAAPLG